MQGSLTEMLSAPNANIRVAVGCYRVSGILEVLGESEHSVDLPFRSIAGHRLETSSTDVVDRKLIIDA